jgi:hypothetical protein
LLSVIFPSLKHFDNDIRKSKLYDLDTIKKLAEIPIDYFNKNNSRYLPNQLMIEANGTA